MSKWKLVASPPSGRLMLSESPLWGGFPVLLRDVTNWWPLLSFINGGNKLAAVVVGRLG